MAATNTKMKTPVTIYGEDGSMYVGHVNECGAKHGQGTLKTEMYLYGCMGDDNSHLMKWTEYTGNWSNGVLHGQCIMRHMSGNGVAQVVHDGTTTAECNSCYETKPCTVEEEDLKDGQEYYYCAECRAFWEEDAKADVPKFPQHIV
jgi:hypothetical protein